MKKKMEMPKLIAKEKAPSLKGCNGCDREIAGCRLGGRGKQRDVR